MLGFLGTVIGITVALDNLDLNTINESSKKLSAGLAVAFDTTGLAIALDVVLFFVQFLVYRGESNLISETDRLTEMELCGRFELGNSHEGNNREKDDPIIAVRHMLETIGSSIEQTAKRQTNIWEQSADTFKISLASALKEGMDYHAQSLAKAESELLMHVNRTTMQFNDAFSKSAASILAMREETSRQMETFREILGTQSQLIQLESSLRENLSVLASVGNFEETLHSLAAAIHLLNNNRRNELRAG